jgi:hypothetical protein
MFAAYIHMKLFVSIHYQKHLDNTTYLWTVLAESTKWFCGLGAVPRPIKAIFVLKSFSFHVDVLCRTICKIYASNFLKSFTFSKTELAHQRVSNPTKKKLWRTSQYPTNPVCRIFSFGTVHVCKCKGLEMLAYWPTFHSVSVETRIISRYLSSSYRNLNHFF